MALWLASDVHATVIDDDIVFLDVAADAYLCLVQASILVALGEGGAVKPLDEASAQTLIEAGLVSQSPGPPIRAIPPKPTLDLRAAARRPHSREIAASLLASGAAAHDFRRFGFGQIVERARRARLSVDAPGGVAHHEAVLDAAAVFAALRPWSPVGGACLKRSYQLLGYLRRLGLDADWVIGVRTWPFMAHCWLQSGPVALDDDVERLVAYTPILAV
jgi:hypothetical protein